MEHVDTPGRPQVGISILVVRDDHILLGRRKGSHGEGQYGGPGGHLENGESLPQCVYREISEECGAHVKVTQPRFLCFTNLREYLPKHYADVGMAVHWVSGEPENTEPGKLADWEWHPMDRLPDNRFGALDNLITAYHTGQPFFDDWIKGDG